MKWETLKNRAQNAFREELGRIDPRSARFFSRQMMGIGQSCAR